jgi:predicted Zn-dependent protease with MMP-like domain
MSAAVASQVVGGVRVSRRRFEELVADALDSIPPELAEQMENVAVLVEDWPTPEQLAGRGGTLLGLYEGIALTDRSPLSYAGVMPDRITVFRGPLCELARDEHDLADQVRVTVVHEVAHHFGIDDDELEELGWV